MAYETNRFCWHGLQTTDPEQAKKFYPEVVGWTVEAVEMGGDVVAMFAAGPAPLCHVTKPPVAGVPSVWMNYLRVDDVDATLKAVEAAGGRVVSPGTDIPPGRFGVIASPTGAVLSVFHEADESAAQHHPGGEGSVHWTELHSQDLDADIAFLETVFGFDVGEMPIPDGGRYLLLKSGDDMRGGAMKAMMAEAPSSWLSWFHVADVDAAAERAKTNGGSVLGEPMDMAGVGRVVVCTDTTGAHFGLITPAG